MHLPLPIVFCFRASAAPTENSAALTFANKVLGATMVEAAINIAAPGVGLVHTMRGALATFHAFLACPADQAAAPGSPAQSLVESMEWLYTPPSVEPKERAYRAVLQQLRTEIASFISCLPRRGATAKAHAISQAALTDIMEALFPERRTTRTVSSRVGAPGSFLVRIPTPAITDVKSRLISSCTLDARSFKRRRTLNPALSAGREAGGLLGGAAGSVCIVGAGCNVTVSPSAAIPRVAGEAVIAPHGMLDQGVPILRPRFPSASVPAAVPPSARRRSERAVPQPRKPAAPRTHRRSSGGGAAPLILCVLDGVDAGTRDGGPSAAAAPAAANALLPAPTALSAAASALAEVPIPLHSVRGVALADPPGEPRCAPPRAALPCMPHPRLQGGPQWRRLRSSLQAPCGRASTRLLASLRPRNSRRRRTAHPRRARPWLQPASTCVCFLGRPCS